MCATGRYCDGKAKTSAIKEGHVPSESGAHIITAIRHLDNQKGAGLPKQSSYRNRCFGKKGTRQDERDCADVIQIQVAFPSNRVHSKKVLLTHMLCATSPQYVQSFKVVFRFSMMALRIYYRGRGVRNNNNVLSGDYYINTCTRKKQWALCRGSIEGNSTISRWVSKRPSQTC